MEAKLNEDGILEITVETETEYYALSTWQIRNVSNVGVSSEMYAFEIVKGYEK